MGRVDIYSETEEGTRYKYFTYVGHIAEITSLPAYLAAKWLCAGKFDHLPGGVYAPERLLEQPDGFIEELKNLGVEIYESDILNSDFHYAPPLVLMLPSHSYYKILYQFYRIFEAILMQYPFPGSFSFWDHISITESLLDGTGDKRTHITLNSP